MPMINNNKRGRSSSSSSAGPTTRSPSCSKCSGNNNNNNGVIARLLMVDLQKEKPAYVASALEGLQEKLRHFADDSDCSHHEHDHSSTGPDSNCAMAYSLGAPAMVLLAMRKWPLNEDVQREGFKCLSYLALNKDANIAIIHCGGVETILEAMESFDRGSVCYNGFIAFQHIFRWIQEDPVVEEAAHQFVDDDSGGLQFIINTMIRARLSPIVQNRGCHLLENLARNQSLHDRLNEEQAVNVVKTALRNFPEHPNIQKHGKKFVKLMMT